MGRLKVSPKESSGIVAGDLLENGAHPGGDKGQVIGELLFGRSIEARIPVLLCEDAEEVGRGEGGGDFDGEGAGLGIGGGGETGER